MGDLMASGTSVPEVSVDPIRHHLVTKGIAVQKLDLCVNTWKNKTKMVMNIQVCPHISIGSESL
jgi:hypothetical protein